MPVFNLRGPLLRNIYSDHERPAKCSHSANVDANSAQLELCSTTGLAYVN